MHLGNNTFARVTTAISTADKTGNAAQPQDSSGNRGYGFEQKKKTHQNSKNSEFQPVIQVFNHDQGTFQEIQIIREKIKMD